MISNWKLLTLKKWCLFYSDLARVADCFTALVPHNSRGNLKP